MYTEKSLLFATVLVSSVLMAALVLPAQTSGQGTVEGVLLKSDNGDPYKSAKIYDEEGDVLTEVAENGSFSFFIAEGTYTFIAKADTPFVGEIVAATLDNITVTAGNVTNLGTVSGTGHPGLSTLTDKDSPWPYVIVGVIVVVIVALALVVVRRRRKKEAEPQAQDDAPEKGLD